MRFSVVIPAHNGELYLRFAIESVLNQTRKADEIIIIDDASTDKTADIIQSIESRERVKYIVNEESTGFVDAWNRAIEKASGDFVVILHQDDLLCPEYLYHIEKAIENYPEVRHLYSGCNYINELGDIIKSTPQPHSVEPKLCSGKEYAKNYLNGVITNQHIHRCPGVTTNRKLLLDQCAYRKEAGHIADDDFFLRVGVFTNVIGISQPLASFRHHAESCTSKAESLTLNLAQDYIYQVKYYKENRTILDQDDSQKIKRQAVKFINLLLSQSLLYSRKDWTSTALSLRKELEEMSPFFMDQNMPFWTKIMWYLLESQNLNHRLPVLYVRTLNKLISIRNAYLRKSL